MSDTVKNTVQYNYFCPLIDEKEALEKRKNCDTANMNFTDKTGKGLLTLFYGHLSTKEPVGPLTVLNKMVRECRLNVHKVVDFLIKHSSFTKISRAFQIDFFKQLFFVKTKPEEFYQLGNRKALDCSF